MSTELRNGENCDSYNLKGFSKTLKNNNNNKPTSWWSRYLTAISGAVLKGDNLFTPTALWIQKPTCKHLIWITFVFAPTDSQLQISKIQSSCLSGISWQICKYSVKASAWPRTDLSSVLKLLWKDCFFFITKERGEKICKISEDNDQVPNPRLPMAACPRAALDQPAPEEHLHDSEVQQTFLDDFTVRSTESNMCYISGKYLAK